MDRNVITATVLIAIIMVVWLTWLAPQPPEPGTELPVVGETSELDNSSDFVEQGDPEIGAVQALAADDSTFVRGLTGDSREITIENSLYRAVLSTRGGTFTSFELKDYNVSGTDYAVQLVDTTKGGALGVLFTSPGNRNYDTRAFLFESDAREGTITVGDAPVTVRMKTAVGDGSIILVYTFQPESYEVGLSIDQSNASAFSTREGYELAWNGGVPFSERDHETAAQRTGAYARSGGSVEEVMLASDAYVEQSLRGEVDWVAVKNKYFTIVMMPQVTSRGAELIGERVGEVSEAYGRHDYVAMLQMPPAAAEPDQFTLYMGPMIYGNLNDYDLDLYNMVDFGWDFFEIITRPLARFVFIPAFTYLAAIIPSYGLVIIILAFLIKLVLYPLTKTSFKSMAKMRELQPRMEVIKEKHADNPQKQQEAMMKMYKETGVNPLGGCLPMLLQYPVIIALWQFLPQAIELRGQGFLWASDLSAPDFIIDLPFEIPMYGAGVAGFTLLMGISMVFQMKLSMTNQSNAQAKIFTYVFPVMIFVIFNKLAAGLNLYYLCYNVLTAVQQKFINKQVHNHPEEMKPAAKEKKKATASVKDKSKRGAITGKRKPRG
ncbi:MAG: membrane protein insertase YidC [Bacteroidetes bacterium]|nr:membrane protein insertase YidC [Bacteroidota bacterium]